MTLPISAPPAFAAAQAAYARGEPPRLTPTGDPATARAAAEDFEAFFLTQMVSHMFAGIETDPLFGGGPGENVFRSMLFQEYGKELASSGGVGIADSLMQQMLKMQEVE